MFAKPSKINSIIMRKTFALLILLGIGVSSVGYAGGKQCAMKTSAKVKEKSTCTATQTACCAAKGIKAASLSPSNHGATLLAKR